jgi:signal transduction histidine kinase
VRWGAHLCHFYRTREELEEIVVPFFAAGVANHEKCIWIATAQLPAERARALFARALPDLDARIGDGQVAIIDRDDWIARTGVLDNERRIEHWLERERIALADGFSGLRITGDTTWIETDAWRELATHEARLHRALHGRRITALCSYELDRCGPHEIIDVLRNHKSALMRRNGVWEHIGSATAALAFATTPSGSKHHTVEFFEQEDFPASSMARRLADALSTAHGAVAVCSREHLAQLRKAIARRLDPSEHLASGRLVLIDADTLYAACVDALDFEAAIDIAIGGPVRTLVEKHGKARIYGELVDVCCQQSRRDLAVRVERWLNRLLEQQPIDLHCGYTVSSFDNAESIHDFRAVCDEHGHVFARNQINAPDPNRLAAELQQVSSILEVEVAKRAAAETEALVSREHLVVLQRITSALGEAVTYDNLGAVVTAEISRALEASRVALVIGGQLIALRGITTPEDTTTIAQLIEHLPAQWTTSDERTPELAWIGGELVAVMPLVFAQDRIGTLLLGFEKDELTIAERALTDDLVRQLSLSVERARVYEQATQDRVVAERASAARDQFLAMLGHELRNPLSPILSATQLMRLRAPEQLVKERSTIERSVTRMIRLVDDLLDVAQIARGEITLAREPTELCDVVQEAVEAARAVIDDRMRFAVAIPSGLVADLDRARMRQVIVNLIVNAAKSGDEDDAGIEIAARAAGESIELVLRDEGNGIEPELLPHVFDLFVQARQGLDRSRGGLGIGLPIARTIVELHGGTISVTSEGEGTGATFTIALPRWQVQRNTDRIVMPIKPFGARRILVVDDNEDAAWLLAEALRLLGHEVRITHDGISALAMAREWTPEVALLDIGLPGMNGFELCRELAKLPQRPYTIAVSGYGQPKDRALAREAGFDAHFVKPVDLRDVQTAIEALSQSN